jgi:hypothetical protein
LRAAQSCGETGVLFQKVPSIPLRVIKGTF